MHSQICLHKEMVTFECLFVFTATFILVSPSRGSKVNFIGYSPAGLPLYSITGEALHKTSVSILGLLKGGLRHILEESDSRKIFYFLCINMVWQFFVQHFCFSSSLAWLQSLDSFHFLTMQHKTPKWFHKLVFVISVLFIVFDDIKSTWHPPPSF